MDWDARAVAAVLILAGATSGMAVWAWIAATALAGRSIVSREPRNDVPWNGWETLGLVVGFLAGQSVAVSVVDYAMGSRDDMLPMLVANAVASFLLMALACFALNARGASGADFGLSAIELPRDLKIGVSGFVAMALIVYPVQAFLQWAGGRLEHPVEEVMRHDSSLTTIAAIAFVAILVAPVVEEFLFRVVLQGWLEKFFARRAGTVPGFTAGFANEVSPVERSLDVIENAPRALSREGGSPHWQPNNPYAAPALPAPVESATEPQLDSATRWLPIVLSALLFAVMHAQAWPSPVPLFFFALALGYIYQATHRLAPVVIMHASINGFSVLMLWLNLMAGEL